MSMFTLIVSNCSDKNSSQVWQSSEDFESGGKLRVAATTTMVQDLVKVIGGEQVEIYGLMGEGVDPHSYTGRASDTEALKTADIVFYSGHHLEGNFHDILEDMDRAHAVTSEMEESDLIIPEEEHSKYADPHVWGDPKLWAKAIPVVMNALVKKDPENEAQYKERAQAYEQQLKELNTWVLGRLAEVPVDQRILVTSHDAFMYYARAFDFEVRAIDGLAPGDKGGPQKVKSLIAFIKEQQLKMIFPESAANSKGIDAIAKDAGVAVSEHELFADATGKHGEMETMNGDTYDVGTYIGMIKHNVNAIVEGLK